MRKEYYSGEMVQTAIAKKYSISQRAVSLIVRGETYRNV